jgi:activator of HSP90 ATPase
LRATLQKFPQALIDAHGKDVKINFDAGKEPSVGTAANAANAPPSQHSTESRAAASTTTPGTKKVNTSSISETFEFQTLAKELYTTFVDPARLAAWTRAQPNVNAREGGKYALFNGNVEGSFLALQENEKLVQTWRLKDWPAGHFAKLTLTFDQGLDGTNLRMVMEDVPLGTEEVVKTNFVECKHFPASHDALLIHRLRQAHQDDFRFRCCFVDVLRLETMHSSIRGIAIRTSLTSL